jgi:hypothetical protein
MGTVVAENYYLDQNLKVDPKALIKPAHRYV